MAQSSENVAARPGDKPLAQINAERERLFARMMEAPEDLDAAFTYAALSSQAGDLEAAISTLERMLIFAPGLPRLQLELGVLYYRLGAYETARHYFSAATEADDVPPEVREKVMQYLAAIDLRAKDTALNGMVRAGTRYQSNANAGPNSGNVTLNGLPFVLDSLSVAGQDVNAYVNGALRYRHDLDIQGVSLEAGLSGYAARYRKRDSLNTLSVDGYVGPNIDLGFLGLDDRTLGLFITSSAVMLENDRYLESWGASSNFIWQPRPSDTLTARFDYRHESYSNSASRQTASLQSGDRFDGQLGFERQVNERLSLSARLLAGQRIAQSDHLSFKTLGAGVGAALSFAPLVGEGRDWIFAVDAAVQHQLHDRPDAMLSSNTRQRDHDFSLSFRQIAPISDSAALVAEAGYRKVMSNYDIKSFDNFSVTVGIQSSF